MSFWATSDGKSAASENSSFEIEGGGNFAPIPSGTKVLAAIHGAKWRTVKDGDDKYVEIDWAVLKPEPYKNRRIFQKVWVLDYDPSVKDAAKAKAKKDKALKMFSAIDANAGGKLAKSNEEPDNDALALALVGKTMVIGLNTWDDQETKKPRGNWVYYVGPKTDEISSVTKEEVQKQQNEYASQSGGTTSFGRDLDDEIPF